MTFRNWPRRTAPDHSTNQRKACSSELAISSAHKSAQTVLTTTMLEEILFGDPSVRQHARNPCEDNGLCATRVIDLLHLLTPPVPHVLRQVLIWSSSRDRRPIDHLVVVVNIDAQEWVIDPTAARFPGLTPMIKRVADWSAALSAATPNNCIIKWIDTTIVKATVFPVMKSADAVRGELIRSAKWIWAD